MRKLLSILICMSMLLSLAYIPVSAAEEAAFVPAAELFFDDFSAESADYAFNDTFGAFMYNAPSLTVIDGQLHMDRANAKDTRWGFALPNSAAPLPEGADGTEKYVIEFQHSSNENYKALRAYVTEEGGNAVINRAYNSEPVLENGIYYMIVDGSASTATGYYPVSGVPAAGNPVRISSLANGVGIGFAAVDSYNPGAGKGTHTTFDYMAVYTLEDSFKAELTDVKSISRTSVTLKTNMPIDVSWEGTALKIGDRSVTITKTANSYNTYTLTVAEPLTDGDYTLSGTVKTLVNNKTEHISIAFTYEHIFVPATELFFDDFTAVRDDYTINTSFMSNTWSTPILSVANGKLNVGAGTVTTSNGSLWGLEIPSSAVPLPEGADGTEKYVVEFQFSSSYGYNGLAYYVGGQQLFYGRPISAGGVYYALVDGSTGQATAYTPVSGVLTPGTAKNIASIADGLGVGLVAPNGGSHNSAFDYIAVYALGAAFEGKAESIDTAKATLTTNMPLDLTKSTVTVGGAAAAVTKNDNTYNEYTVTFASEVQIGTHTMTVNAVPVGGTTAQTAEMRFTVE